MAENSKIEWTHHTFNPWWGCAKVSPGCDHCYAERDAGRFTPDTVLWGVDAARREFGDKHWAAPLAWNAKAAREGVRSRVFCASMADIFDKNAPDGARDRLWALIKATPHLDWLLLTKRISNAKSMLPADWGAGYPNVWLGISVVHQEEADRDIPKLQGTPAVVRWLSMEPLLGQVSIHPICRKNDDGDWTYCDYPLEGKRSTKGGQYDAPRIDWVVLGGESGPKARPLHPDWARKIRDQCAKAGVPFLFKQWGEYVHEVPAHLDIEPDVYLNDSGDTASEDEAIIKGGYWKGMYRIGKKAAGRTLDGVQHDGYPKQDEAVQP